LNNNNISGGIVGVSGLVSLKSLDVSNNLLSGFLDIGFPFYLRYFVAHSNHFYGTFPSSLVNCSQLELLDLRENRLIGELPMHVTNFSELRVLSMAYNNLHGDIPQWITNLTNLQVLDLSNNKFSGRIPSNLEGLEGFKVNKSFTNKSDVSTLYYELRIDMKGGVYDLPYVLLTNTILDLSSNDLMGEIPPSMGTLTSLRLLNLSRNELDGQIHVSIANISTLEQLDLAENNLSGCIPQELSQLSWLASLNVSSNNLCGPIPSGKQFNTFTETSFQRNKCLCGYPLQLCKHQKRSPARDVDSQSNVKEGWLRHVDENMSLIALAMGMGIGFGGVVAMFITSKKARSWVVPPNRRPFYGVYRFPK
jgi:Leucine-rich repeat (LRR) protein